MDQDKNQLKSIIFENKPLKIIPDVNPNYIIYVPDYEPTPFSEFRSEQYYISFFIVKFPNGFGYGWSSNFISSVKLSSNMKKYSSHEQAYKAAIEELLKYYTKPHFKMLSLRAFLNVELQPKDLFSFEY